MLEAVKCKALTAKRTASGAVLAAGSAVRQGLGAVKEKGYGASLKMPLAANAPAVGGPGLEAVGLSEQLVPLVANASAVGPADLEAVGPSEQSVPLLANAAAGGQRSKFDARTVKEQLMMAGYAAKTGVERVKHTCDVAAAGAAEKVITASSSAKGKCDVGVGAVMNKIDSVQAAVFGSSPVLGMVEAECVDMLVAMGFPHKDAARAVRRIGTDDVNSVVAFLCQEPGRRASAPDWDSRIAECIARRMVEIELDEEENVQIALALSKFQAEASEANGHHLPAASPFLPFHCWEDSTSSEEPCVHITGMVCPQQEPTTPFHLRPSVGTWMQPLCKATKAPSSPHLATPDPCMDTASEITSLNACANVENTKIVEARTLTSSRKGAVRCGA